MFDFHNRCLYASASLSVSFSNYVATDLWAVFHYYQLEKLFFLYDGCLILFVVVDVLNNNIADPKQVEVMLLNVHFLYKRNFLSTSSCLVDHPSSIHHHSYRYIAVIIIAVCLVVLLVQ